MTPEQFKALGLKAEDIVQVTVRSRVTDVGDFESDDRPLRLVSESGVIFWPVLTDCLAIEIVETPLAVGDNVYETGVARAIDIALLRRPVA